MNNPIYKPKGRAAEYGEYAINIYTGCPHKCFYCYAPSVLRKDKEEFHSHIEPRKGIVEAVKKQLDNSGMMGKIIHLCFTVDPYPIGYDSVPTREVIKAIKESGNHVQLLTKNGKDATRDFDLFDSGDWFGVTYAGYPNIADGISPDEPGAGEPRGRLYALKAAKEKGIKTWVSCEPVLNTDDVLYLIEKADYIDLFKIGLLNYYPSIINWGDFGSRCERLCKVKGRNYYIKEDLRAEMEV